MFGGGIHFLLTLETIVFLFHLLGSTSKPFSSLSIRLAHAARLGFFLQERAMQIHCYYYYLFSSSSSGTDTALRSNTVRSYARSENNY